MFLLGLNHTHNKWKKKKIKTNIFASLVLKLDFWRKWGQNKHFYTQSTYFIKYPQNNISN